ncbi:MAG: hypothetical protein JWR34_6956 [Mycobacterium sp.]|nr:hypothetical protein [Mycobacterium sp.]
MSITGHQHADRHRAAPRLHTPATSFTSVYVDLAATHDAVASAVAKLPLPTGVTKVLIDDRSFTDTFGCRIAIDLTGAFDEAAEGRAIARGYARRLSDLLGVPAFALYDLLRADSSRFAY